MFRAVRCVQKSGGAGRECKDEGLKGRLLGAWSEITLQQSSGSLYLILYSVGSLLNENDEQPVAEVNPSNQMMTLKISLSHKCIQQ